MSITIPQIASTVYMQYVYYITTSRDEYIYMTYDNTCKNYMYAFGGWRDVRWCM